MGPTCLRDHPAPRWSGRLRVCPHPWPQEVGLGGVRGPWVEHPRAKSTAVCGAWCGVWRGARCRRTFQGGWRGASAEGQGKGPFMEAFLH